MNNKNNFSKRTASQVKAIIAKAGLHYDVENQGDGRTFAISCIDTLQNRIILKKELGFILTRRIAAHYMIVEAF